MEWWLLVSGNHEIDIVRYNNHLHDKPTMYMNVYVYYISYMIHHKDISTKKHTFSLAYWTKYHMLVCSYIFVTKVKECLTRYCLCTQPTHLKVHLCFWRYDSWVGFTGVQVHFLPMISSCVRLQVWRLDPANCRSLSAACKVCVRSHVYPFAYAYSIHSMSGLYQLVLHPYCSIDIVCLLYLQS